MTSFFDLRHKLAELYPLPNDPRRFGQDSGLDMTLVDLTGTPFDCWASILEAARRQRRLSTFFKRIAEESEDDRNLLPLMAEVERNQLSRPESFISPIDVSTILVNESEERELSALLVNALAQLPERLVDVALSASLPQTSGGRNTAEANVALSRYRTECAEHERRMKQLRNQLESVANEKSRQIQQIRQQRQPEEPTKPRRPSEPFYPGAVSLQQRRCDAEWYSRSLSEFYGDLAEYERKLTEHQLELKKYWETQAQIPALEGELADRKGEVERENNNIREFRLKQFPTIAALEDRIRSARDQDQIEYLSSLINESGAILSGLTSRGIETFAKFLLAAAINAKCQQAQMPSVASLIDIFMRTREVVEMQLADRLDDIARPLLASIALTLRTLALNKQKIDQIDSILNTVPAKELAEKLEELTLLQYTPLPLVPEYKKLVSQSDLESVGRLVSERIQSLASHLLAIEVELGEEGRSLKESVAAAQASAYQVQVMMNQNAIDAISIARGIESVFALASTAMPLLGAWGHQFHDSIRIEAETRAGISVDELVSRSVGRQFLVVDAQVLIKNHRSTEYLHCRGALETKLRDGQIRTQQLQAAADGILQKPAFERDQFLSKFRGLWMTALLPVGNLWKSSALSADVISLRDALGGTFPEYRELAAKGARCICWALLVSILMSLMVAVVLWSMVFYWQSLKNRDGAPALFLLGLAFAEITYLWNMVRMFFNLFRWYSFSKRGGSVP